MVNTTDKPFTDRFKFYVEIPIAEDKRSVIIDSSDEKLPRPKK